MRVDGFREIFERNFLSRIIVQMGHDLIDPVKNWRALLQQLIEFIISNICAFHVILKLLLKFVQPSYLLRQCCLVLEKCAERRFGLFDAILDASIIPGGSFSRGRGRSLYFSLALGWNTTAGLNLGLSV